MTTSPALLPRFYRDPAVLEAEHERILERSWQLAGHVSQLAEPGDYMTTHAGTQPVLVLRDKQGGLRAFRNVCRHRGSRVLSGEGQCGKAIRCRYHGWTYRLDGSLIGMPEVRSFGEIDKSRLGLHPANVDEFCGLVFVNLDLDAIPLSEQLGELEEHLAPYRIPSLVPFGSTEGHQSVNWKIVIDNYLEGYHVPIAHPGLMRLLDYKRYELELGEHYAWFEAPLRDKPAGTRLERAYRRFVKPMPGLDAEAVRMWQYVFIYPNTAIDLYPDQVMTWRINPDGVLANARLVHRVSTRSAWASQPPRAADEHEAEHDGPRGGRRPGRERPGRARHPRVPAGPAVGSRGRRGVVRGSRARRPGGGRYDGRARVPDREPERSRELAGELAE